MTKRQTAPEDSGRRDADDGPAPVQALARGLSILSQFTIQTPALSLAELGRKTGIHRGTIYRFVKTLQTEGFLVLDTTTGLYRVGPAWAAALYLLGGNLILSDILGEDLQTLADTTGESASLSIRKGNQIQLISAVSSSSNFMPVPPPSPFVPLSEYAAVHSRIHLAYSSEATRRKMTAVPAIRHTEYTITDRATIEARLAQTAAEGIAYSREEYRKGLCAVAVPVFSQDSVIAALGLVLPVEHYDDNLERFSHELRAAAAAMGQRLEEGFSPPPRGSRATPPTRSRKG